MEERCRALDVKDLGVLIEMHRDIMSKKHLCQLLGMTENGLTYAIRNETLKLKTFQEICKHLRIDICELYEKGIAQYRAEMVHMPVREIEDTEDRKNIQEEYRKEIEYLREVNIYLMKTLKTLEDRNMGKQDK